MLQQTQVATVIPYYERFMQRFPDVESLANAAIDEVLHLWTGLGYYTRARNLHKTAKIVVHDYDGEFPQSVDELSELPGIGRSTAGAIRALGHGIAATILDGNVKRVLSRCYAVEGWPGTTSTLKQLWELAEELTPKRDIVAYTQGIMDLGATVCTRSKPQCGQCPMQRVCRAHELGREQDFPGKKPRKAIPVKQTHLIIACYQQQVLLEQRPPRGIWGGLWSFPEFDGDLQSLAQWCQKYFNEIYAAHDVWPEFRHTFSHYHLDITPIRLELKTKPEDFMDSQQRVWYKIDQEIAVGLAAPVKRLLMQLGS